MTVPASERVYLDAELQPHRSLGPRGFLAIMALLGAVSFAGGLAFVVAGAWPVIGFLGLDVAIVYLAFRASYRSGRCRESVRLTDAAIEVRRTDARGRSESWRAVPAWLQVAVENPDAHDARLVLRSHGQSVTLGAFLAPSERNDLAAALRAALARLRAARG